MPIQNFPDNILYELDNLDVLRGMNSATVDLIATDPPFNTRRNRSGTAGFYVDNWKWGDTGILPDQWAWNEVHPVWLEQIKDDNPALHDVIQAARAAIYEAVASVKAARTKESKERTKQGRMLFAPVDMNSQFKEAFRGRGFREMRDTYTVTIPNSEVAVAGAFKQVDFVKDGVFVEVQFGKYAFMAKERCCSPLWIPAYAGRPVMGALPSAAWNSNPERFRVEERLERRSISTPTTSFRSL